MKKIILFPIKVILRALFLVLSITIVVPLIGLILTGDGDLGFIGDTWDAINEL